MVVHAYGVSVLRIKNIDANWLLRFKHYDHRGSQ